MSALGDLLDAFVVLVRSRHRSYARRPHSIGLLRDRIEAPLFCVYYSTNPDENFVKVEYLDGPSTGLEDGGSRMVSIAGMAHADLGLTIAQAVLSWK